MATESSETSLFIDGAVVDGAYRVVGELASGGMGVVYEVEQLTTGARRALKAMNLHMSRDAKLRARFVQEARVGAVIKSDHVASILDAGVDDASGIPYLVMELLEGRTLSRALRHRGAFTWPEVAEIMRQIGHALGAAHAARVVHRDPKPANVFLAASRMAGMPYVIKLLDFGIAKVVADAHDGATAIIGTPAWMAPEQTEVDASVGPPADVWALGLLAFMLFVGRHYWPSANHKSAATATVMRDLVLGEIVPASMRAISYEAGDRLPPGFDAWFARCVDRDPSHRFADASIAHAAFAEVMRPLVAPESAPSLAQMAARSIPPPAIAATGEMPTIAEGAISRSSSRVDLAGGVPAPSRRARAVWAVGALVAGRWGRRVCLLSALARRRHGRCARGVRVCVGSVRGESRRAPPPRVEHDRRPARAGARRRVPQEANGERGRRRASHGRRRNDRPCGERPNAASDRNLRARIVDRAFRPRGRRLRHRDVVASQPLRRSGQDRRRRARRQRARHRPRRHRRHREPRERRVTPLQASALSNLRRHDDAVVVRRRERLGDPRPRPRRRVGDVRHVQDAVPRQATARAGCDAPRVEQPTLGRRRRRRRRDRIRGHRRRPEREGVDD